jgi:hypothetical protein
VGDDFCVAWQTNRYSAGPSHPGRQAWVRVLEGQVEIESRSPSWASSTDASQ